jgi:hypothetical protein
MSWEVSRKQDAEMAFFESDVGPNESDNLLQE